MFTDSWALHQAAVWDAWHQPGEDVCAATVREDPGGQGQHAGPDLRQGVQRQRLLQTWSLCARAGAHQVKETFSCVCVIECVCVRVCVCVRERMNECEWDISVLESFSTIRLNGSKQVSIHSAGVFTGLWFVTKNPKHVQCTLPVNPAYPAETSTWCMAWSYGWSMTGCLIWCPLTLFSTYLYSYSEVKWKIVEKLKWRPILNVHSKSYYHVISEKSSHQQTTTTVNLLTYCRCVLAFLFMCFVSRRKRKR